LPGAARLRYPASPADNLALPPADRVHHGVQFNRFNWRVWGSIGALFLVVLGAKLWVIRSYGAALPYWDQWDEAKNLFKPWLEGQWTWNMWFGPHNEHRIFFTRALDVLELWLNGQWDPLLQMVVNAFLHTGYACGLAYGLWVFTGRRPAAEICFLLMPFFALPFAAENSLHGFQSQVYFLGIFSVGAMAGLGFGKPWSGGWWCGWAAAILALFTMGSGLLAMVAVIGLLGLRTLKQKGLGRDRMTVLGGCLAIMALGLALEKAGMHRPQAFGTFAAALLGNLAWPFIDQPVMVLVTALPLSITAIKYFRSYYRDPRAAEFVLTLGLWAFLQSAALAYARAHLGSSSRYMDTLSIFSLAGLASLFIPEEPAAYRRLSRTLMGWLAVVWTGWMFWGMWQLTWSTMGGRQVENYMQFSRRTSLIQEQNVQAFMATGDPAHLVDKPLWDIPYLDADTLMTLLRDPALRKIMPSACRPPFQLDRDERFDALLVLNGGPPKTPKPEWMPVWGNCSNEVALTGHFVSQPLEASFPCLSLKSFCTPSTAGVQVRLVEPDGLRAMDLTPRLPGRWQNFIVCAPRNPFRLEVANQNRETWVAVGGIEELGRLSAGARLLLNQAVVVLLLGLGLSVLLAGGAVLRRGLPREDLFLPGNFTAWMIFLAVLLALAWVWWSRNFTPG
jgi:hypothetical protein